MHGQRLGLAGSVNAEVDSMGGVIDGGVSLDTKTSPRQAAIEKAQAELRQEYDVREERKRELEFLEKGGNPLDFKFCHPASISVQSTSLADQPLEQEAKGSFALATSPQGDSVESSGRPRNILARESNIADNLLLFDDENNNLDGERNGIHTGKRKGPTPVQQTSKLNGSHIAKGSEDTFLHLGVKSQAYARRNRSKSNREIGHASAADSATSDHVNRSLILPPSQPNANDAKAEAHMDDCATSIPNLKQSSLYEHNVSKTFVSDNKLSTELVTLGQPDELRTDKAVPESKAEVMASENSQVVKGRDIFSQSVGEQVPNGTSTSDKGEEAVPVYHTQAPLEIPINKESNIEAKAVDDSKDLSSGMSYRDEVQAGGRWSGHSVVDSSTLNNLEAEPSHAKANADVNVNGTNLKCLSKGPDGSSGEDLKEQKPACEADPDTDGAKGHATSRSVDDDNNATVIRNPHIQVKEEGFCDERIDMYNIKGTKADANISQPGGNYCSSVLDTSAVVNDKATCSQILNASTLVSFVHELSDASLIMKNSASTLEPQNTIGNNPKLSKKAHEDAILKEARIIQAKRKRAGELPVCSFSLERQQKSHWDYVLEEMAWLANDFMQERLWKITAAAQVCHKIALIGQSKFVNDNLCQKQRTVAKTLAKAIIEFWHSAEKNKESAEEDLGNHLRLPIQRYAMRLLQSNSSVQIVLAEAPRTPERITDAGNLEMSWEDQFSEECLFYKIPHGSLQVYRESVESNWLHHEKMGNNMRQVDCEVSVGDSAAVEFRNQENALEDDEDETVMYYMPGGYEGNKPPKTFHKKKKTLEQKFGATRSYETNFDLPYISSLDSKMGTQQPSLLGKRPSTLNVGSIPTKRVRTAARQRIIGPFSAATAGAVQMTSKTDVSSGDTNSLQDDEISLQGVSQRKNSEFESTMDFVKPLPYDGAEVSTKPKKKKRPKYMGYKNPSNSNDCGGYLASGKGSAYERKWPMDSLAQLDQDLSKRKLETHHFESNGTSGLYVHHATKKPKFLRQLSETSPEAAAPTSGLTPSPVASQMSNMSNSNKLIRVISNRDRGRKSKVQKGAASQSGSGSPWSVFEDQALVVLVHDMGPNWELVSDAINSTLRFKCIFHKPKECKERHKVLMDKSSGDGADSAEDSGSSQPYPSTLPGIPKGSARQLFQRLQGPMEEDALKAHFEKIIGLGQKLHPRRSQELKQISPAHNSHILALSQASPNNLTGGPLTPLDLCDTSPSNADVLGLGYQGPHANGLGIPSHQAPVSTTLPPPNASTVLQGSPGVVMGNSFPSSSALPNAPARDSPRCGVPRPSSLPIDDQQRMKYNQLFSGRTAHGPLPLGADRGVRMLSGGNGMGVMCGMNRNVAVPRTGYQAIGTPGVLNMVSSSSMLSSNGVGLPSAANIHPSGVSNQGSSMTRSRDALPMLRNSEDHRQMIMQELQMQVTQGNGQANKPFNGMSSPYTNQTIPPPAAQTFPVQQNQQPRQIPQGPQQPHVGNPHYPHIQGPNHTSPQQQAYAMRLAKERQLQQRLLHQQQSFPNSSAMTPIQSNSQQQPTQPSAPPQPISPSTSQHKQQNLPRNPQASGTLSNQIMKQRQRQQFQQQQPRQQSQQQQSAQHQSKLMKGVGRGNVLMHQNVPVETSQINGGPAAPGNQAFEKQTVQQNQNLYSGSSGLNNSMPQPTNPQKMYPCSPPQSLKQMPPMSSHTDNGNQGQVHAPPKHNIQGPQQPPLTKHQQQRQVNQPHPTMHRVMLHQNRQLSSDSSSQPAADTVQVNQMIPVMPVTQSADSVSVNSNATSGPSAVSHWKPESSFESSAPTSASNLSHSPQTNLVGGMDPLIPSSSQGLPQRQFSGSYPVHGHAIGGAWQQQQQQLQQPPTSHQQLHRQAGQGALYGRSSNPGPG